MSREWIIFKCWKNTREEKSIMSITSRMLLRLEKSVKIPERALYKIISRHFSEAKNKINLENFNIKI